MPAVASQSPPELTQGFPRPPLWAWPGRTWAWVCLGREKCGFAYTKPYFGTQIRIQRNPRKWCQQLLLGATLHTRRGPG